MSEWQPIETAPRDGTVIIGYIPRIGMALMRFTSADQFMEELELSKFTRAVGGEGTQAQWWVADFCLGFRLNEYTGQPTKWMPLPNPPKDET